ncbi:MAG: hypothetical protein IPL52_02505 [Flavobacteriales bacterium]|nr:hypothetical protein [Flavobacteriales bacterium]
MSDTADEQGETKARKRDRRVRAYPWPAKAWLALSSDPDNTLIDDWHELDRVIWNELGLPFADSLFLRSFNLNLPEQVDLARHPQILEAHPHDTIHTWGDYVWSGPKSFERVDAIEGRETLARAGFKPRVWVDHSLFMGNMLHNHRYGSMPTMSDASGHVYPNPLYTLDIARHVGVRYMWDGTITPVLGQDRPLSFWGLQRARNANRRSAALVTAKHAVGKMLGIGEAFRSQFRDNAAYRPHRFPDGSVLYTFPRHGTWADADIDGLGRLLAPLRTDALLRNGGTCILYTHLGKRPADRMREHTHIPPHTLGGLRYLHDRWKEGSIILSSASRLLDYLVLRDHLVVDEEQGVIRFHADGIAFTQVEASDLAGHRFTFVGSGLDPANLKVSGTAGMIPHVTEEHGNDGITITFVS